MSVWTDVTGTVTFNKMCGMSLKTLIVEMFQEAVPAIITLPSKNGRVVASVTFSFSDSNLQAAKTMQKFVDKIKGYDKDAYVDLEANIRFLG